MIIVELEMPKVDGLGEESIEALRPDILVFCDEAAVNLRDRVKSKLLSGQGRGEPDESGHRASTPGDAPAKKSGEYAESWESDTRSLKTSMQGRVGSRFWRLFGATLEWGNGRIEPRPHFGPSFQAWRRWVIEQFTRQERG